MKLELFYPVKPYIKYQNFGANEACSQISTLPVGKRKIVSKVDGLCPVGYEELYPILGMKGHTGMDMFGGHDWPCYSSTDGVVEEVQTEVERGLGIGIITKEKYTFPEGEYNVKTRYWHLKGINVEKGQEIKAGHLVGWCDNTGLSAGDHLHFELKPVLKAENGSWYNVFQSNGYFGSIDPEPFFNRKFAQDIGKFQYNLEYGMRGNEVKRLQSVLKTMGYFKYPDCTGFYGDETAKAVLAFQWNRGIINSFQYFFYKGRYFHDKTRKELNNLI